MTDIDPYVRRHRSLHALGPVVIVVGVVLATLWWVHGDPDDTPPDTVLIEATGPRFDTVAELVAASDLVVRGTVTDIETGRTLTDPADPGTGIRTQLARIEVDDVVVGSLAGPLVVEQEDSLVDGTPVIVNGIAPLCEGDTGYLFLIRGDSDEFPYTAFVNEQGWVPVVDGLLAPIDPTPWDDLAGRRAQDLERAVE